MKDRLIELLNKKYDHFCDQCGVNKDSHYTENLADYLLENGVIVPSCKVGQTVYVANKGDGLWWQGEVLSIYRTKEDYLTFGIEFKDGEFGAYKEDEVFLTREEAEAKMKEG